MIDYDKLENIGNEILDIFENFTIDTLKKIAIAHGNHNSINSINFVSYLQCPKCERTVDIVELLNNDRGKKYICPKCNNEFKLINYDYIGTIVIGSEDDSKMRYTEYDREYIISTYFHNLNKIEIIYILKYVFSKNAICGLFLKNHIKVTPKYEFSIFDMNPVNYITKIPDCVFKIIKTLYDPSTVSGFSYEIKILAQIKKEIEELDVVRIIDDKDLQRQNRTHIINLKDNEEYIIDSECVAKLKEPQHD